MGLVSESFIVNSKGEKMAVVMPMQRYERLLESRKTLPAIARRGKSNSVKIKGGITELRQLLFQLPQSELVELFEELESRIETFEMMHVAESAFAEWLEPEEDTYDEE